MSGFLHRLAARALGSAHTVRSAAHLPYVPQPLPVNMPNSDGQNALLKIPGHERGSVSGQPQHPASQHMESRVQPSAEYEDPPSPESLVAFEGEDTLPSPEVLVAQTDSEFSVKPERASVQTQSVKSRLRQSYASVAKTVAVVPPVSAENIETDVPMSSHVTDAISDIEQDPTILEVESPSPLLPLKSTVRPTAFNAGAQRGEPGTSISQGGVEKTSEVHVSIGRIEVTAVHEAPAPKRQVPTNSKPMSLDEYLDRRRRET